MTEQQQYRVLYTQGNFEVRAYLEHVVAQVEVVGNAEQAASAAFQPLFRYISGANESANKIAMTAPVIQQSSGEKIEMTAPVIQEKSGNNQWTVSFVLPAGRTLEQFPKPTDSRVSLHTIPEEIAASLRWSGSWTSANVNRWTEELHNRIAEAGWKETGEPRWARFDPPMKLPFLRRNEIVIPISGI
ncbi:MAG: SOUL family heme-binding protein [Candidatus Nanopelagicales bacterium]